MTQKILLGIPGSNRTDSYNALLLKSMSPLLPENIKLEVASLDNLPTSLKKIDAVVFSTPEYNYSYPEILHQAIDGAGSIWTGKPFAIIGASMDTYGAPKAVRHLQEDMVQKGMLAIPTQTVSLISIASKFDSSGELTDNQAKGELKKLVSDIIKYLH